jgi:hypothetical protein
MSPDVARPIGTTPSAAAVERLSPRRARQAERRRLAAQDALSAQRACLHRIRELLAEARLLVDAGWVQNGWFGYRTAEGHQHTVSAHAAVRMGDRPVDAACLVGAILTAGGGVGAARTQPVQRALDLTWHTLHSGGDEPVRWCPPPAVRAARVRELTFWNDRPGRTRAEVTGLLAAVEAAAVAESARLSS